MLLCYIALMKVHPFEQLILKIIFIWGKKWGGITIFLYQKKKRLMITLRNDWVIND